MFLHLQELCVDLELRNWPALLSGSLSALLNASKQVVDGPGNDTQLVLSDVDVEAGSHGVGLPRTRLDKGQKTELESVTLLYQSAFVLLSKCIFTVFFCMFHQPFNNSTDLKHSESL